MNACDLLTSLASWRWTPPPTKPLFSRRSSFFAGVSHCRLLLSTCQIRLGRPPCNDVACCASSMPSRIQKIRSPKKQLPPQLCTCVMQACKLQKREPTRKAEFITPAYKSSGVGTRWPRSYSGVYRDPYRFASARSSCVCRSREPQTAYVKCLALAAEHHSHKRGTGDF